MGSDKRGLIATFCVVTSTASSWTHIAADGWWILGRLGDLPVRRLQTKELTREPQQNNARPHADVSQSRVQVEAAACLVYLLVCGACEQGDEL